MEYEWLSLATVLQHEADAASVGAGKFSRSPNGFVRAYELAEGDLNKIINTQVPGSTQTWGARRTWFIARHVREVRDFPTERARLSLVMWAYRVR
jgi:hypothetical protein